MNGRCCGITTGKLPVWKPPVTVARHGRGGTRVTTSPCGWKADGRLPSAGCRMWPISLVEMRFQPRHSLHCFRLGCLSAIVYSRIWPKRPPAVVGTCKHRRVSPWRRYVKLPSPRRQITTRSLPSAFAMMLTRSSTADRCHRHRTSATSDMVRVHYIRPGSGASAPSDLLPNGEYEVESSQSTLCARVTIADIRFRRYARGKAKVRRNKGE